MLSEAHQVSIEELPHDLTAFAAVEQLPAFDGGLRDRVDRRGRPRCDKVCGSAGEVLSLRPWTRHA